MKTKVEIKWDTPKDQDWLCDKNIEIALSAHCKNTKFEVSELKEMTASEALYSFCGWLTSREDKTIMSSKSNCAPVAERVGEFIDNNKLSQPRDSWCKNIESSS